MRRLQLLVSLGLLFSLLTACGTDPSQTFQSAPDDPTTSEGAKSAWEQSASQRTIEGKADAPPCSGVRVPDQNGFDKRIALTFDDGPDPNTTPRILDTLSEHDAPAAFFTMGSQVDRHPETYKQIVEAGHIVGNHTYTHRNMESLPSDSVRDELASTEESMSDLGPNPDFVRFPYGAAGCAETEIAENMNYRVTGWHIDSADWCFASATGGVGHCSESTFAGIPDPHRDNMIRYILSQAREFNGGILLMHDIKSYTARTLDRILTRLQNAGFEFVRLDNEEVFPKLNSLDDASNDQPWIGTPCGDSASDDTAICDFDEQASCLQYSANPDSDAAAPSEADTTYGFCTLPCEGFCNDLEGKARTFCVQMPGSSETGHCVAKAAPENDYCEAIPGAAPSEANRFIGASDAPETTATVCLPADR